MASAGDKLLTAHTIHEVRNTLTAAQRAGRSIGFIPTMGYLHQGHASLIELCGKHADYLVVSVFVNPTQFGPREDFTQYPRDLERDCKLIEASGAHLLFAPAVEEIYPEDSRISFAVQDLAEHLCGQKRPGHFEGVLLVVAKLFHIVQPDVAVFGQKDLQQLLIIKRMVKDLHLPIRIIAGPIVRELDGLAMSSRNTYLSPEERHSSTVLYRALQQGRELIEAGERRALAVTAALAKMISQVPASRIDYVEIVETERLQPIEEIAGRIAIALAVYIGQTRLIDNIVLEVRDGRVSEIPALT